MTGSSVPVGVSSLERLEALVANDELFALADAVPEPDSSQGGRPRMYPPYMWLLFDALLSVYGSGRRVEAELAHPLIWSHLRSLIRDRFPREPERWLPDEPMRRHHYTYGRNRWPTEPFVFDGLRRIHREHAVGQARQLGLLDPRGPGSHTHPHLSRMLYADGKVLTPLFKAKPGETQVDKATGEVRLVRAEKDAGLHFEGTGETAWGTKWVVMAVRTTDVHGRVILDVDWVPSPGAEAATAMNAVTALAPLCHGALGLIYDTALRGVHHQRLLRDLGLLPLNKVTAAKAPTKAARRSGGHRVEKSVHIEDRTVPGIDGTSRTISLFAQGGAVGVATLTDTGTRVFTELRRVRTQRNSDKSGHRWYNTYQLPDHRRRHQGPAARQCRDQRRRFNRAENVRPIPPSDPDFKQLYRRRSDAESINRALDDTLWLRRAHSVGHARQHLNMLTFALGVNSLALHRHRRSSDPPLPNAA